MEDPLITYTRNKFAARAEKGPITEDAWFNLLAERDELRLKLLQTEEWWHKEWHQSTGIPCDGTSKYCPRARRGGPDV